MVTAIVVKIFYDVFRFFLLLCSKYTKINIMTHTCEYNYTVFYGKIKHIIVHGHFTLILCLRYWAVLRSAAFNVSNATFGVSRCRRPIENYGFRLKLVNTIRNYYVYVVRRALSMANNANTFDKNVKIVK